MSRPVVSFYPLETRLRIGFKACGKQKRWKKVASLAHNKLADCQMASTQPRKRKKVASKRKGGR